MKPDRCDVKSLGATRVDFAGKYAKERKKSLESLMYIAYVIFTVLAAAANAYGATLDFVRYKKILLMMANLGVPESWLPRLGILKATGAIGLLVGFRLPLIGTAAAIGLILFFISAIITHLRARDSSFGGAVVFLMLAAAALVLGLHARGSEAWMLSCVSWQPPR